MIDRQNYMLQSEVNADLIALQHEEAEARLALVVDLRVERSRRADHINQPLPISIVFVVHNVDLAANIE